MIDVLWRDGLLPGVVPVVHQLQTAAGVLQSDARAASVLSGLGVVGIVAGEDDGIVYLFQMNIDSGGGIAVCTMFKGILDERYEEKRGDLCLSVRD